ncbi:hypothetical protein M0D21_12095 [Aquimarina sp. D1M17]|uniref:hypothetical protein n=1 Tax=Aquimarina acroporae TaxID=2937283 RepID=UPI0020BFD1B7|nr:hypothetical protein [Aquimarina acroporae]MCK8522317.1 hypothetical protein [Aquimarina acroporae]
MNAFKISILLLLTANISWAQTSNLSIFEPLTGKVWKADGNWGDGSKFKQEIEFKFDLNNTIVIASSKGYTNKEQTTYGPRNHGVRNYNNDKKIIEFWEFDIFGGVTTGTVINEGKNIVYTYTYGTSTVTDMWEFVDENTYVFKVGNYENGTWKQVYLETKFVASN